MNRYLLGTATDAEDTEIAVRIIEDPTYAEEVSRAEHDLIEDYLEGELPTPERELFEKHYFSSDERCERIREIALLKKYAIRSTKVASVGDEDVNSESWIRNFRILIPAFGALLIAVAAFVLFSREPNRDDVRTDPAKSPGSMISGTKPVQQDLSDLGAVTNAQVVLILPGIFRDSSPAAVALVTGTSPSVLFRLPLTFSVAEDAVYEAAIEGDGRKVFGIERVSLYTEDGSPEARMLVPRDVLSIGTYQIRLSPKESNQAPLFYTFEVR